MSKYSALINKLWPGAAGAESRAIAESFVAKFGDMPLADVHVEGLLREAGRIDAAIGAGEMTRDEGAALFSKDTFIETGMQPHVATAIASSADETIANLAAADMPPAEPDSADEPAADAAPAPVKAQPSPKGAYKPLADAPAKAASADRIAEIEQKYMRAPEGPAEWRQYWNETAMKEEYLGLLSAREEAGAPGTAPGGVA